MSRTKIILLLALLAAVGTWGWLQISSQRSLTQKAVHYPLPRGWLNDAAFARLGHCWLSNVTLLVPREVAPDQYQFARLDLASGTTITLTNLEALAQGIQWQGDASVWDLSPDGRRLLLANGDATNATVILGDIDGSRRRVWQMPWAGGNFAWLPDSTGLITLDDRDSNCVVRVIRFDSQAVQEIPTPQLEDSELLGFTSSQTLLTRKSPNEWSASSQAEVKLGEWKLAPSFSLVREITVPLPQPAEHADVMLSPRGDRLAWNLFSTRKHFALLRARRFPFFRRQPYMLQSLWISGCDGKQMRRQGNFEPGTVVEVAWTPDGEHLEFAWPDAIYLLSVK